MAQEHFVVIDGFALPAQLSGHPVLDFCNTRTGWDGAEDKDYLQGYDHLAAWAQFTGLISPERTRTLRDHAGRNPHDAEAALGHARAVRARIYAALLRFDDPEALAPVGHDLRAALAHIGLATAGDGPTWEIDRQAGLGAPSVAVVWSAAHLLASPDRDLIRACPGRGCGWLFLDRSGRRRWCTMTTCGNREKARRFAAKRHRRP